MRKFEKLFFCKIYFWIAYQDMISICLTILVVMNKSLLNIYRVKWLLNVVTNETYLYEDNDTIRQCHL
jgi:hypothetical protein